MEKIIQLILSFFNKTMNTNVQTAIAPESSKLSVTSTNYGTVTIIRISDNGVETQGTLFAEKDGARFSCATLELPWKDNQHDISCIPKGLYTASVEPFHDLHMYELSGTEPRTGIFIHPGNYYRDSLGCILLGVHPQDINGDKEVDVMSSVNTVASFMTFMHNQPFTLLVK